MCGPEEETSMPRSQWRRTVWGVSSWMARVAAVMVWVGFVSGVGREGVVMGVVVVVVVEVELGGQVGRGVIGIGWWHQGW